MFQISPENLSADNLLLFLILTLIFLVLCRFQYLYRISIIDSGPNQTRRIVFTTLVGHILMVIIFFLFKYRFITERLYVLISFCLMTALLLIARLLVLPLLKSLLKKTSVLKKKTLLIGSGEKALDLFNHFKKIKGCYYRIAAVISLDGTDGTFVPELEKSNALLYRGVNHLEKAVHENDIREIIVAFDPEDTMTLLSLIEECRKLGIPVNAYSETFGIVAKKTVIDQFHRLPLARFGNHRNWDRNPLNRMINFSLSLVLLILLSPLLLLIAALIKLTSKGPVFYIDKRIGRNEKPINMIKFRSMKTNQPDSAHKNYTKQFINGEIETGSFYKLQNDSRITVVGRILRRYSLDELPQLFNVIRGDMNLVGPRPSKIYEYEQYDEWHKKRFQTTPGMTGLWQVKARSEVPFKDMIALDLYYAYTSHFWLDMDILARTLKAILIGKGAV